MAPSQAIANHFSYAHADLDKENADALHYSVVPIHDLVSIQLESGLIVLEALKNGEIKPLAD